MQRKNKRQLITIWNLIWTYIISYDQYIYRIRLNCNKTFLYDIFYYFLLNNLRRLVIFCWIINFNSLTFYTIETSHVIIRRCSRWLFNPSCLIKNHQVKLWTIHRHRKWRNKGSSSCQLNKFLDYFDIINDYYSYLIHCSLRIYALFRNIKLIFFLLIKLKTITLISCTVLLSHELK